MKIIDGIYQLLTPFPQFTFEDAKMLRRQLEEHPRVTKGLPYVLPYLLKAGSDETTHAAAVLDATISGFLRDYGLRYTVGVYNVTDWRFEVPVTETFASRTIPQNGRTFLIDLLATFP